MSIVACHGFLSAHGAARTDVIQPLLNGFIEPCFLTLTFLEPGLFAQFICQVLHVAGREGEQSGMLLQKHDATLSLPRLNVNDGLAGAESIPQGAQWLEEAKV